MRGEELVPLRIKKGLAMPRVRQIGIVVRDMDKAIGYFETVLGLGPWAVFEGEPVWCRENDREVTYKGKMALAQSGSVQLELIQILEGRSLYSDLLGDGEGIHHLGFFVRDFEARMRAAREAGIPVLQHALLKKLGLTIEYAYLDTTETGGVITEYIKSSFLGLPFPMNCGPLVRLSAWFAEKVG
jgi:catechol 2,3-dioxygenase-like lactoylglutathione lyase family enzyme